jgi:hypothetical protein
MKTFMNITALFVIILISSSVQASDLGKKLNGTWKYEAAEAPYDYQEGEIVFYEEDGKAKVKIITTYDVIKGQKVKAENNKVTFEFYVEYELCTATLNYKDDKLTGEVETVEGTIPITLKRK